MICRACKQTHLNLQFIKTDQNPSFPKHFLASSFQICPGKITLQKFRLSLFSHVSKTVTGTNEENTKIENPDVKSWKRETVTMRIGVFYKQLSLTAPHATDHCQPGGTLCVIWREEKCEVSMLIFSAEAYLSQPFTVHICQYIGYLLYTHITYILLVGLHEK